jgi:hypothetical protein
MGTRPAALGLELKAADREEALPRMPLPTKPAVTDPFSYEDPDEEAETED